jgi:hypothetical protein
VGYRGLQSPVSRSDLAQETKEFPIPFSLFRRTTGTPITETYSSVYFGHDAVETDARMRIRASAFLGTATPKTHVEGILSEAFITGQPFDVIVNVKYDYYSTPPLSEVDVEFYKLDDAGLETGGDLCVTAAQAFNGTPADKTFSISPTSSLAAGDRVKIVIAGNLTETDDYFLTMYIGSVRSSCEIKG